MGAGDLNSGSDAYPASLPCFVTSPVFLTLVLCLHMIQGLSRQAPNGSVSASKLSLIGTTVNMCRPVSETRTFRHAKAPKADPLPCQARALPAGTPRPAG